MNFDNSPTIERLVALTLLGVATAACGGNNGANADEDTRAMNEEPPGTVESMTERPGGTLEEEDIIVFAKAEVAAKSDSSVSGVVEFEQNEHFTRIRGELTGLEPGVHGFHVHTTGDCTAPDASTAGGHFAPDGDPHGAATQPSSMNHVGDLGNIVADDTGKATIDIVDLEITLNEGNAAVVDRAVIVHADADDLVSQPSGAAGARVGCGVIRAVPRPDYTP